MVFGGLDMPGSRHRTEVCTHGFRNCSR